MADVDEDDHLHSGFPSYHRTCSCSTLPENHSAVSMLHQFDRVWFRDNVLGAPSFRSCLPSRRPTSPPRKCPSSPQREPFRSIELVQFLSTKASKIRKSIISGLPRPHFEKLQGLGVAKEAPENSDAHQPAFRRRKQLGEICVSVPGQRLKDTSYWQLTAATRLVEASPVSDSGGIFRIERDRGNVNRESSCCKGKLQTIMSGKQLRESVTDLHEHEISVKRWLRRERRRLSKSMTDLEVDELQGFMDLGFHFKKDDLTPRVVNLFPVLQRQLRGETEGGRSPEMTALETKPFWSESWWMQRPASPILNWRIPALAEGSDEMKEHLKFWARAVASTVRQEC